MTDTTIECGIPKNVKSVDAKNSIPMWFLMFNEGNHGKPLETLNEPYEESKNIIRTKFKNTE